MTRWNGRVLYIDGFAGPGIYEGGEEGSPVIALKAAVEHKAQLKGQMAFLFIEADRRRFDVLKKQIDGITVPNNIKVVGRCRKFDETLTEALNFVDEQKKTLAPTFAFLDPFGFSHTPFSLVQRLMQYERCEVLITFMYEEINRFLDHPELPVNYDKLFGSRRWREGISIKDPEERKRFIHNLYRDQLHQAAGIEFVRSFEMLNRGNRTDYFLFFGTKNLIGLKKMKEAMWKVDESGGFQFADATDINQVVLFESTPNFDDLKNRIVQKFRARRVAVEDIERFVVVDTPYRETHYKRPILRPMELATSPELRLITRPGKNTKGTFPEGTVIQIL